MLNEKYQIELKNCNKFLNKTRKTKATTADIPKIRIEFNN